MSLEEAGWCRVSDAINGVSLQELEDFFEKVNGPGSRRALDFPAVRSISNTEPIKALTSSILSDRARPVRAILFDKSQENNWKVPFHQDLAVALNEHVSVQGFGPWSVKEEIPHAIAPQELLERMISIRIHFDDCPAENGALRVIEGSHKLGKLSGESIVRLVHDSEQMTAEAKRGDLVLMRPLLVHASSESAVKTRRRVLHIEFSDFELPSPIRWYF